MLIWFFIIIFFLKREGLMWPLCPRKTDNCNKLGAIFGTWKKEKENQIQGFGRWKQANKSLTGNQGFGSWKQGKQSPPPFIPGEPVACSEWLDTPLVVFSPNTTHWTIIVASSRSSVYGRKLRARAKPWWSQLRAHVHHMCTRARASMTCSELEQSPPPQA